MLELINQFKDFFEPNGIEWAVCGGGAIDLFVGRKTRNHKDLDIAALWENREKIIDYMIDKNWQVFEPDGGKLRRITTTENDLRTSDNIWCLSENNINYSVRHLYDDYYDIACNTDNQINLDFVEFLFNRVKGGQYEYKRNTSIKLAAKNAVLTNKNNIPFLAPELILLYKSTFIKYLETTETSLIKTIKDYEHDFDVTIDLMTSEQIIWLSHALKVCYLNGHEWIDKINSLLHN